MKCYLLSITIAVLAASCGTQTAIKGNGDETVNIGYGTVSKRNYIGGGENTITAEQLRQANRSSLLDCLQGLAPGLEIGYEGGTRKVTIRGNNSFYGDNTPLYVLDGCIIDDLDIVNVYDVKCVEIMKMASIYGSRGANGAIIVTTFGARK